MIKKIKHFWFNLSDKIRFILVGGFNFGVSYIIFSGMLFFIVGEERYQLALISAWIISSVISFTTQRTFVFPVEGNIFKQYIKCCITWVFSYLINAFALGFLVQNFHLNPYLAQIFACFTAAVFTYIMFKVFAFRKR